MRTENGEGPLEQLEGDAQNVGTQPEAAAENPPGAARARIARLKIGMLRAPNEVLPANITEKPACLGQPAQSRHAKERDMTGRVEVNPAAPNTRRPSDARLGVTTTRVPPGFKISRQRANTDPGA